MFGHAGNVEQVQYILAERRSTKLSSFSAVPRAHQRRDGTVHDLCLRRTSQPRANTRCRSGCLEEKNSSRGAKHGLSGRPKMYYQAKAWRPPNDTFTMVRRRRIQKVVVSHRVERERLMLYGRIAVEKHIYVAARAERIQSSKLWILTANAEGGTQQSLNQRPDFAQAKRECKRLHDEHLAITQEYRTFLAVNK